MKNVILIGMPSSGKTTVGSELTNALRLKFIDTDQLLKDKHQTLIPLLINEVGIEKFKELENEIYMSLDVTNSVISTGGSVIYSDSAMHHLKEIGTLVYLSLPYEDIEKRIDDPVKRGVVMNEGQTLLELYEERTPLYAKYADITVYCEGKTVSEIVTDIVEKLSEFNKE